jgi:hypothetical protein
MHTGALKRHALKEKTTKTYSKLKETKKNQLLSFNFLTTHLSLILQETKQIFIKTSSSWLPLRSKPKISKKISKIKKYKNNSRTKTRL